MKIKFFKINIGSLGKKTCLSHAFFSCFSILSCSSGVMRESSYLQWVEERIGGGEVEGSSMYVTSLRSFAKKGNREIGWYLEGNIRSKEGFFFLGWEI